MAKSIFLEEVCERASIARSARYKKGKGGRAVHTKLPSDHMTTAQRNKMNGPVVSYQLGKPMVWDAFKVLPDSIQKEYLNRLVNKYGGTPANIANMFGVGEHIVRNYARTLGVQFSTDNHTEDRKNAWEYFVKDTSKAETVQETPVQDYNLNQAYSYKDFKAMPDKTKKAYLERLMSRYGATCSDIAAMFGCSDQTVRRVADALNVSKKKGRSNKQAKAWSRFLRLNADFMAKLAPVSAEPETNSVTAPVSPAPVQDETVTETISVIDAAPVQPEPVVPVSDEPVPDPIPEPVADAPADPIQSPAVPDSADLVSILSGSMTLTGPANECLDKIAAFLGNTHCTITVQWAVQENAAQ